jgi:RNA polymerase sporulation-specific sigma factor
MNTTATSYEALVEENMGLVHSCCHRLTGKGIEYDDLFGAGCLGLCKAAKGFDPTRGLCFSTYAVPVILGEIRRLFRDGGSVKVSRSLKELSMKINRVSGPLAKELGREPTMQELAIKLEVSPEQIAEALCAARPVLSLTVGEQGEQEQLDVRVESCEEAFCDRHSLYQTLQNLPTDEYRLIVLRYFHGKTQTVTAKELNMTQVQVSRKERVILQKLRKGFL